MDMFTVVETPTFLKSAEKLWTEQDRVEFVNWIASHPKAGDVIPESGGLRKVRWTRQGSGTRGGVRVIYFNVLEDGKIWLLIVYAKSKFDNLPKALLRDLKERENG